MIASEWNMSDDDVLNLRISIWKRKVESFIKKQIGFDGLKEIEKPLSQEDLRKQLEMSGLFEVKRNG